MKKKRGFLVYFPLASPLNALHRIAVSQGDENSEMAEKIRGMWIYAEKPQPFLLAPTQDDPLQLWHQWSDESASSHVSCSPEGVVPSHVSL